MDLNRQQHQKAKNLIIIKKNKNKQSYLQEEESDCTLGAFNTTTSNNKQNNNITKLENNMQRQTSTTFMMRMMTNIMSPKGAAGRSTSSASVLSGQQKEDVGCFVSRHDNVAEKGGAIMLSAKERRKQEVDLRISGSRSSNDNGLQSARTQLGASEQTTQLDIMTTNMKSNGDYSHKITNNQQQHQLNEASISLPPLTLALSRPHSSDMLADRPQEQQQQQATTITTSQSLRSFKNRNYVPLLIGYLLLLLTLLASLGHIPSIEAIKLQPEGKEKFYWSGEQFIITCQNNNNIKNVKFRWLAPNETEISERRMDRVHTESAGPHGYRLVVMNATPNTDDGLYRCLIGSTDDRSPRETQDFQLKLFKKTSFKETPKHLVLPVSSKGVLSCYVEFDPAVIQPTVSWHRDGRPIEMYNDSLYSVLEYDSNKQLSQLTIKPLTRKHDGIYTCRADAITSHLSKISEHEIRLETQFAPSFEQTSPQIIWVERSTGSASGNNVAVSSSGGRSTNLYGANNRPSLGTGSSYQKQGRFRNPINGRRMEDSSLESASNGSSTSSLEANGTNIVRLELKCECQANPPASILWFDSESRFSLSAGKPAHVLDEPRQIVQGSTTTSTLLIGYNLDQNWAHKETTYVCSATNQLGSESMNFKIEQGDPPPAFEVASQKFYDPLTSMFRFTLTALNLDPDSPLSHHNSNQQQQAISPPVDSFRIRADSASGGANIHPESGGSSSRIHGDRHQRPRIRYPAAELPNVQWSVSSNASSQLQLSSSTLQLPQTFNVSLGKLPSGNHRLFLEAHNAVGWSTNSTYLGEFNLVSGASSGANAPYPLLAYLLVLCSALCFALRIVSGGNTISGQKGAWF